MGPHTDQLLQQAGPLLQRRPRPIQALARDGQAHRVARAHQPAELTFRRRQGIRRKEEQGPDAACLQGVQNVVQRPAAGALEGQVDRQTVLLLRLVRAAVRWRGGRAGCGLGALVQLLEVFIVAGGHGQPAGRGDKLLGVQPLLPVCDTDQGAVVGGGIGVIQSKEAAHPGQGDKHPPVAQRGTHVLRLSGEAVGAGARVQVKHKHAVQAVEGKLVLGLRPLLPVGDSQVHPRHRPVEGGVGHIYVPVDPGGHGGQGQVQHLVVLRHQIDGDLIRLGRPGQQEAQEQRRRAQAGQIFLDAAHGAPPFPAKAVPFLSFRHEARRNGRMTPDFAVPPQGGSRWTASGITAVLRLLYHEIPAG